MRHTPITPLPSTTWLSCTRDMGDYARAEPLLREALAISKKALGADHPDYATSLNNLASLYRAMGDYARAEPMYREALAIRKKALGADHPDYARSLNNLALLYKAMGDHARAEPMYREALAIGKKALGEDHPDYATSLNNLAALYHDMGDYARAEPMLPRGAGDPEEGLGCRPPRLRPIASTTWPCCTRDMGDYARAEPMLREALAITKKALGADHPDYARSLNNLAVLYQAMGDYARAEPMLREALAIRKKALGEDHPDYAKSLSNLARLYLAMGDYARAEPLIIEALKITSDFTRGTSAVLGERQRLRMYQSQRGALDAYLSMSRSTGAKPADLYRHVLDWKGAAEARRGEDRLARDQPELATSLVQLAQVRSQLANLAFRAPPAGQGRGLASAARQAARSQGRSRGGSGPPECRLPRTEASGTAGARRGGRGPARRGRPGRLPRYTPTSAHPRVARGRFRKSGDCWRSSCAAAGPWPSLPLGAARAHRRVGPVLAACPRCAPGRCLADGGRRAGPAGLGAVAAPSGRRPYRPDRPRRRPRRSSPSPPYPGAGPART